MGEHSLLALESHLPKQFYSLAYKSQEETVFLWVPLNRLKASGVGLHVPVGPAGEAAAFQEKRLFEWAIYRASPVPADEWDIQANKGGRVIT